MTTQPAESKFTNRLARATSPYLLQHAHNPVDWHEWNAEALRLAREQDRPIFLSIGYAACHWCHVMAHESFENQDIAAILNRHFVNIKVDREERPDLDEIYMQATQILNQGQGGWPMSVWMTPELKPFYAGTYFPPESRWGRPGFGDLCERIATVWRDNRKDIEADAEKLTSVIADSLKSTPEGAAEFSLSAIDRTAEMLSRAFDAEHGGLLSGGTNKFPPSMAMDIMLRSVHRSASATAPASPSETAPADKIAALVELTLDRMAHGGIYDQLAGGIARYSTDREWLVPHFEKMLYDQALVSRIYIDAWQRMRKPLYRRIASEIFDYVLADLQSPGGGFYSTRDADSEGEEGKYYVWTHAEVLTALGAEDGELFCAYYNIRPAGNWVDPHAPGVPKNILHITRDVAAFARERSRDAGAIEQRLAAARQKLLAVRSRRTPPGLDDKVLCEWNGLMIASLARGGAALGETKYINAAVRAADFVLKHQYTGGRLQRAWRDGRKLETAFLTDYACLIEGMIELYEATFESRWLATALELNDVAHKLFWDDANGGYFFTPADHETLIARSKDARDSATPSGNSVQLMNLLRLSALTGNSDLRARADRVMKHYASSVLSSPGSSERFLAAVDFALSGAVEIAIIGDPADAATQALLRVAHESYVPNRVIGLRNPRAESSAIRSPLLAARELVDGAPAAYVCRNYVCRRPVTSPTGLREQLAAHAR